MVDCMEIFPRNLKYLELLIILRNNDNSLIIRSLRFLKQIDTKAIGLGKFSCHLLTNILILVVLRLYRKLKECRLKYILQDIVLYTYKFTTG